MVAMRSALLKDTFREIKRTLSRFLSIFLIVALGVAFFAGVKATSPDMKITADKYFDDYNLMDMRLVSTMGFDEDDVKAVKELSGLQGVSPSYSLDALVKAKDKELVVKVLGLPITKLEGKDETYINRVKLIEGRLPQKPGECVAEKTKLLNAELSLGSTVKLFSGTEKDISEKLKVDEFTVVGIVETPYYISFERGTSSIGSGKVNSFVMIPEENFKLPVYTDMFITVKGAREQLSYDEKYDKIIEPVKKKLEKVGESRAYIRYNNIVYEAIEKIEASKKELKDSEAKSKNELASAASKLEISKTQLEEAKKQLEEKEHSTYTLLTHGEEKIDRECLKLQAGEAEYEAQMNLFDEKKQAAEQEFAKAEIDIAHAEAEINKKRQEIDAAKLLLATGENLTPEERAFLEASIKLGEQQIAEAQLALEASKKQLEEKKKELSQNELKLVTTKGMLEESRKQLQIEKDKILSSRKKADSEFKAAHRKLDATQEEFLQGEKDYEKGKEEAEAKISEGYRKIAEGEEELKKLEKPKWYVLDRSMHADFVGYGKAADRIDAIAEVFPVFFFLIAALVCLTTMTRMVDEQRTYIGTLKALGYSKFSIASKYLTYAVIASVGGSIFGLLVGFKVFPTVIFNAYGIIYTLPPVVTEFNLGYAAISTAFAVMSTTLATWISCYKELSAEPAVLMRPKSPKAGKRVFLERIKFIWNNLNFTQKVTVRNLFRYKKRFLMTVMGIGGCTALLLSGFGLKDSIFSIVSKQFDELYKYDMVVSLKESSSKGDAIKTIEDMINDGRITDYMMSKQQNIDVIMGKEEKSATLFIPEDINKLKRFIVFRSRTSEKKVELKDDGVVLTEKLAKMLQVSVGDTINIKSGDSKSAAIKVEGITENYVSHYVYMSPDLYKRVYGEEPKFQQVLAKTKDNRESFENKLSRDLLKNGKISSVSFTSGISNDFKDMISSLNYVILVLIVSAGALAFVVLYNLTNINITERLREIATIKVLGFYDGEVSNYVYRENMLLTIIGMMLGLILGIFLHKFIVVTAEIDYVMFGRDIKFWSYLYSAILTILFSITVNFVMHFRLKTIDMVESLKSVD